MNEINIEFFKDGEAVKAKITMSKKLAELLATMDAPEVDCTHVKGLPAHFVKTPNQKPTRKPERYIS